MEMHAVHVLRALSKKNPKKIAAYQYMNRVYRTDNIKAIRPAYLHHKIPKKHLFPKKPNYDKYIPYKNTKALIINISLSFVNEYIALLKKPTRKQLLYLDKNKKELVTQLIGLLFWNCTKEKRINNGYKVNSYLFSNEELLTLNKIVQTKQQVLTKSVKAIVDYFEEINKEENSKIKYSILDYKKVKQAFLNSIGAKKLFLSSKGNTHFKNCSSFYNIETDSSDLLYYLFSVIKQKFNYYVNNIRNFYKRIREGEPRLNEIIDFLPELYDRNLVEFESYFDPPD